MKYIHLFNTFKPARCCGATFPFDAIATGGAGAINAGTTLYTNNQNLRQQRGENERNRRFSHDEAELARNWQSEEWLKQFNIQREEWYNQQKELSEQNYQQFLKEANYNSPTHQVQRLGQAGFNPSAVLSGNGTGLVSAASGNMQNVGNISVPSGGAQSGAVASAPSSSLPTERPLDLSFIGSMFRDMSEGSKTNKTLQPLLDQMAQQTNLLLQQSLGQKLTNEFNEVRNLVASATKNAKIQQAYADLGYTYAETYLQYKNGEKIDSEILVNKTLEFLNKIKAKCGQEEYLQLVFAVEHMDESFRNMMQNDASQRALNAANAENAHESAVDTASTRSDRLLLMRSQTSLTNIQRELGENQNAFEDETFTARVDNTLQVLENNKALNAESRQKVKESRERIKTLRKQRKFIDAKSEMDIITGYVNSIARVADSFIPL